MTSSADAVDPVARGRAHVGCVTAGMIDHVAVTPDDQGALVCRRRGQSDQPAAARKDEVTFRGGPSPTEVGLQVRLLERR